jgi:hypothetical protein
MKLDRNINGRGKYAIVNLREIERIGGVARGHNPDIAHALRILETNDLIEYGEVGTENEFFVIKLKDKNAAAGLAGYASKAQEDDPEYAYEVSELADRAGENHPNCKKPD